MTPSLRAKIAKAEGTADLKGQIENIINKSGDVTTYEVDQAAQHDEKAKQGRSQQMLLQTENSKQDDTSE